MDRDRLDYLADAWSDEDLRTYWKYTHTRPFPGRETVLDVMWLEHLREVRRMRICRARWGRRVALLHLLLLLLWCLSYSVRVLTPRRERHGDRVQKQAGHGAVAPARGSPAGRTPALATPEVPPL